MKSKLIPVLAITYLGLITASIAFEGAKLQESLAKKEDVFLEADQVDYDQNRGVIVATGKVEVQKGTNVVFADRIIYDQKQDVVEAVGNVSYIGPDGNTIFTDRVILKDDLREGVIKYFRAKLDDGSLIAAAEAKRLNESQTQLSKAVYSPCPLCDNSDPQWQIKAEKVNIDQAAQRVEYEDAYLEVYGLPVAYAPYFSHPTPGADRKSGFLMPNLRTDSNLGVSLKVPYYFNLAPNMEATLEPIITSKEGLVVAGGFKNLTPYGEYEFYGSVTRPRGFTELASDDENDKDVRGHLKGQGKFDVTENWDFGFDGQYTSDDTYLRRYRYDSSTDLITSRAFFDRMNERNFTRLQAVHFRGLLAQDNQDTIPLAMPYARTHIESNYGIIPEFKKSKLVIDSKAFAVSRDLGEDSQRGSFMANLNIPYISAGGNVFETDFSVRADKYFYQDSLGDDETGSRLIPEISFGWRLPLISQNGHKKTLLEPIVKLIATPYSDYNKDIPNEDSQDVEFSELNVFHNNRYRGIDRVENGIRAHYGLRGGYYGDDYGVNYIIGQNYRFKEPRNTPANSGIEDNLSDIVGRISTNYKDIVDLSYRFRLNQDSFSPRRNEVDLGINYYPVELDINYFNLDYDFTNQTDNREEVSGAAKFNVTKEWSLIAQGTRNLSEKRAISARGGIMYEGDCTNIQAVVRKDFIDDRDAKSGTSIDFSIGLKNLGEI